jgi:hypothetical protein
MHDPPCNIRVKWVNVYDCDDTCVRVYICIQYSIRSVSTLGTTWCKRDVYNCMGMYGASYALHSPSYTFWPILIQ